MPTNLSFELIFFMSADNLKHYIST